MEPWFKLDFEDYDARAIPSPARLIWCIVLLEACEDKLHERTLSSSDVNSIEQAVNTLRNEIVRVEELIWDCV